MSTTAVQDSVERLTSSLRAHGVEGARVALVLGSGLGDFVDRVRGARAIPYASIDGMPQSSVPGHAGKLVVGDVGGVRVVVQQGRVHLYEGWSAHEVTRAVRAFGRLGVHALVLTNAAGGMKRAWPPPTLMRITDHVNLQGRTPLLPGEAGSGNPYDAELGAALDEAARASKVPLERGVYVGVLGPSYETPAEIRYLTAFGADAVGMSTVCEAQAGRAAGMRVAAISCITNLAAGLSPGPLNHAEVVEVGKQASQRFCDLLEAAVPRLSARVA
ncbi:MAG: purine-nucleoside phosphorylase [Planctomycetota bacterium]|nr:purine-nucleoside phosphorylase [Planctomycetota bacterium]